MRGLKTSNLWQLFLNRLQTVNGIVVFVSMHMMGSCLFVLSITSVVRISMRLDPLVVRIAEAHLSKDDFSPLHGKYLGPV